MESDFGVPRELSELQKKRAEYHPELPPCLQGTTVRVEFGDSTTCADPSSEHVISRAFPHTFGQPLAHFLRATAKVPDAQIITEHPPMRFVNMSSSALINRSDLEKLFVVLKVVGVPVTFYGDLKNQFVETDVGFDTVCRVNSQLISNVCIDALSAEKYYYFIRLMGRKASHVALECALQSHPNMLILGEEVALSKLTIFDITKQICDAVQTRAEKEKYHGVILIPEGLIESIPELYALLQLLLHPESDDSAQLSQIETEKLFAQLVETEMNRRMKEGIYKGKKFNAICHFFGYQARGSLPSKFDCDYAYVLGHICYHILAAGLNGYMATITNLKHPVNKWRCGAAPLTKASSFLMDDLYRNPGPLQFEGPGADVKTYTLSVEDQDYMGRIKKLQEYLDKVKSIVKPGCSQDVLKAALSSMASVTEVLSVMSTPSFGGRYQPL
ncbi:hypothetical protein C4D60_Mb03t11030 [Musa balbisiana]|uniref:Phosphofructokinase domain-containing protein n=1 Tax=Musa balbisiana TaxID=52838 RepID=A0A4S8JA63_MUSBA|nr:hypothetical protein C4D60_Mb03t11030 [Musa balbisiana]